MNEAMNEREKNPANLAPKYHRAGQQLPTSKYRKLQMISNSFNKQHAKGNPRKLSFDHVTVISTARTYLSITNRSGLMRAFRPYI